MTSWSMFDMGSAGLKKSWAMFD